MPAPAISLNRVFCPPATRSRAEAAAKTQAGVQGHANAILGGNTNLSANDGTITRFDWKPQNKSLLMFAGGAIQRLERRGSAGWAELFEVAIAEDGYSRHTTSLAECVRQLMGMT
jgi:hypothetical protein